MVGTRCEVSTANENRIYKGTPTGRREEGTMSFFGDLLGYDSYGNDLLGYPTDHRHGCAACGVSAMAHTPEMEAECLRKLYARPANVAKAEESEV